IPIIGGVPVAGLAFGVIHRPPLPHHQDPPVRRPPPAAPPPQAPFLHPPLPDDLLRPPHLLHGRLRHRLRRDRRAPRDRIHVGPRHRRRPPRRLHARPRQRPVHHRRPLLRVHVRARRHRDRAHRSGAGQEQG
ncbi:hypothetical protein Tsubulata_044521, partial [Turnera subulata]